MVVHTFESHSLLRSACLQAQVTCLLHLQTAWQPCRPQLPGVIPARGLAPAISAAGWS